MQMVHTLCGASNRKVAGYIDGAMATTSVKRYFSVHICMACAKFVDQWQKFVHKTHAQLLRRVVTRDTDCDLHQH